MDTNSFTSNRAPRFPRRLAAVAICLSLLVVGPAGVASARGNGSGGGNHTARPQQRNPGTVTLDVAPANVDFGDSVHLSGAIAPAAAGETVTIKTGGGDTVATATTDGAGAYSADFSPDSNVTLHAEWGPDVSATVDVGVRAAVTVRLSSVRLFGRAVVEGTVKPAACGADVNVKLMLGGSRAGSAHPSMDCSGAYKTTITVPEPGKYHAVASYGDAQHLVGTASSDNRSTPLPTLHVGSNGVMVGLLEKRLVGLGYRLVNINNGYDHRTADAVLAFRKVQGMDRTDNVTAAVWKALADPRPAVAKFHLKGRHIEVDLSKQVLYVVDDGDVTYTLHISSGKPTTPTPPGRYRIRFKRPGMNASGMYYSSYFLEHFAIHGYASVPSYNASHGCVRVPMWAAKWMYGIAKVGMRMMIYP